MSDSTSKDQDDAAELPQAALSVDSVDPMEVVKRTGRRKNQDKDEALKIRTTQPDELRRHNISDEDLGMLSSESKDGLSEAFWGMVGAAMAAVPSAGEALWNAYIETTPIPLSPLHLIEIMIVTVAACGAFIVGFISRGKSNRIKNLVATIRARPR